MANNFTFYSPTEIVFGRGVQTQAADYLRKYGATKVLVVYGSERVVKNGLLDSIIERTAISRQADGRIVYAADGDEPAGEIAEGTPVSLNLWGFTPSFMDTLDEGLRRFFAEQLPNNPMKGEYYLPFAVDELIRVGRATAQVLTTTARWYGVTYREDKPSVSRAIADLTARGEYPEDL